jgi:membrane-associated phospholipid phosphatase
MSTPELRRRYLKVTLVFYVIWVMVFIAEGFLAVTLPTRDLTSWIDRQIPVLPPFVWFYILCYIFPFVPVAVARNWHRFNIALISVALSTLIAFIGHLAIPIAFPRPQLGTGISDQVLRFIYENDFRPGAQNFPSLHVAIAWIICFACRGQGLHRILERAVMLTVCLISVSTVLIKQHLVVDLVGGMFLGFIVWHLVGRFYALHVVAEENPSSALRRMTKKCLPAFVSTSAILIGVIGCRLL